jgi:hypothetical protein
MGLRRKIQSLFRLHRNVRSGTKRALLFTFSALTLLAFSGQSQGADQENVSAPRTDPVGDYLDAIELAAGQGGAYSAELGDLYIGLGQSLVRDGELEAARDAFNLGVQNIRINSGLNSPQQTNPLFSIADIEFILDDWRAAEDVLQSAFRINERNFGEKHRDLLPVLERIYDWYAIRRPLDSPDSDYEDMQRHLLWAERIAEIREKELGLSDPQRVSM